MNHKQFNKHRSQSSPSYQFEQIFCIRQGLMPNLAEAIDTTDFNWRSDVGRRIELLSEEVDTVHTAIIRTVKAGLAPVIIANQPSVTLTRSLIDLPAEIDFRLINFDDDPEFCFRLIYNPDQRLVAGWQGLFCGNDVQASELLAWPEMISLQMAISQGFNAWLQALSAEEQQQLSHGAATIEQDSLKAEPAPDKQTATNKQLVMKHRHWPAMTLSLSPEGGQWAGPLLTSPEIRDHLGISHAVNSPSLWTLLAETGGRESAETNAAAEQTPGQSLLEQLIAVVDRGVMALVDYCDGGQSDAVAVASGNAQHRKLVVDELELIIELEVDMNSGEMVFTAEFEQPEESLAIAVVVPTEDGMQAVTFTERNSHLLPLTQGYTQVSCEPAGLNAGLLLTLWRLPDQE